MSRRARSFRVRWERTVSFGATDQLIAVYEDSIGVLAQLDIEVAHASIHKERLRKLSVTTACLWKPSA